MTKLQILNYFLQIFFFRVFKVTERGKIKNYGILYFVLPFTGWKDNYIIIGGKIKFYHFK